MSSRALFRLCLLSVLWLGGCRQPDGPLPAPDGEVPNRLEDIGRDLQSIAAGEADATRDLADDLRVFVDDKITAAPASDELSRRVGSALSGIKLTDDHAKQLSRRLWTAVAGRELSDKQRETLMNELQAELLGAGVAADRGQAIAVQAGEVQSQVTNRRRRWYELK